MIDINELREAIQTFGSQAINEGDLNELLDRLEAAEKERGDLLSLLKEARSTLEMWKDVAPAVSLCADIDAAIAKATGEQA